MTKTLSVIAIICFVLIPFHSRSQSPVILVVNVTGAEARPLRNAYVKIISKDFKQEIVRDESRFIIHLPDTGLYSFWAGGVHHKSLTFPLLIEARENIEIEIQLAAARREEKLDSVFIIGDFNKFSTVSNNLPRAQFNKPDSRAAKIASIALDASRRDELFHMSYLDHVRRGGSDEKHYDKSKDRAHYTKLIHEEKDLFVKQYLLLRYFDFLDKEATSEMARLFLEEVSPSSPVWRLYPNVYPFKWVSKALNYSKETEEYVYHLVNSQQHPPLLSSFLSFGLESASLAGNRMLVELYNNRLVNEFPDSPYAVWAVKTYGPNNKFSKGKPVPFFETSDLEDSTLTYTRESLKGKVYLMDFWATWCGPCVDALPDLQKIYDSFKDKGFTILSISADEHAEKIHAFRKKRWAMSWMHTMLRDGLEDPLAVTFEVIDIPKAILVDENGIILASHADIKKEGLQAILDRHFSIQK